jgi:RNA polymerase sigma-70 factor (ECF subfamily)
LNKYKIFDKLLLKNVTNLMCNCFIGEEGRTIMAIRMTEEQFELKYQMYSQDLFNVAYGYTRNVQDAEDIVQNVFIKLLQYEYSFRTNNDEKYWLIRVTINESINFVKSSHKKKIVLDEDIVRSTSDKTKENIDKDNIRFFIEQLPEKYKVVLILCYFENMKTVEISILLDISEAAVRKRLERARDILKKKMEAYNG